MPQKPTRRAYSAEELLALRRSASDEPALAIQRRADDGAIRGESFFPAVWLAAGTFPNEHVIGISLATSAALQFETFLFYNTLLFVAFM